MMTEPVLAHRLLLTPEARLAGRTGTSIVRTIVQAEPIPQANPAAAAAGK
jgi:MoxR-like ATPase